MAIIRQDSELKRINSQASFQQSARDGQPVVPLSDVLRLLGQGDTGGYKRYGLIPEPRT